MRNLCSQSRIHHVVRKSIDATLQPATYIDVIIICTKFVMCSPVKIHTTLMTVVYRDLQLGLIAIRPTYFVL